jgi:hypothetical protein
MNKTAAIRAGFKNLLLFYFWARWLIKANYLLRNLGLLPDKWYSWDMWAVERGMFVLSSFSENAKGAFKERPDAITPCNLPSITQ